MSPLFFISRSRSLSPFFSLSFAGLPPTFSFSLSFSCSIFQICGHDNYSKLNTLENADTETYCRFPFLWSLTMRFPVNITLSCIWVAKPVDWVILHWYTCGADGRSGGLSVYGHVITNISRMGSLPHFLTHGAPLCVRSAINFWVIICSHVSQSSGITMTAAKILDTLFKKLQSSMVQYIYDLHYLLDKCFGMFGHIPFYVYPTTEININKNQTFSIWNIFVQYLKYMSSKW